LKEIGNGSRRPVFPAYKVLPKTTLYAIDEHNYLSLFHLKRETKNIRQAYLDEWLYYALKSPLWAQRVETCGGCTIQEDIKMVEFATEEGMETFYENFGYEPDEQSTETQNKCIQPIIKARTWESFYREQKGRGIIEMDKTLLTGLDKIHLIHL
jgi:hypothetical protein